MDYSKYRYYHNFNREMIKSKLEDWKIGRLEDWKIGRLEDWSIGRLEKWQEQPTIPPFHHFNKNTLPIKITIEPSKYINSNVSV